MKHNSYFDGKVQSLSLTENGKDATIGVMEAGRYTFNTAAPEIMKVLVGKIIAEVPGKDPQTCGPGESFSIPGNTGFSVEVPVDSSYICYYG